MGVGSQRVAVEEPSAADSFQVRDVAPDILLFGNLGAVQLNYGYTVEHCRRAVSMIGADALILAFKRSAGSGSARGQSQLQRTE